jgi:hypothetical protein
MSITCSTNGDIMNSYKILNRNGMQGLNLAQVNCKDWKQLRWQ